MVSNYCNDLIPDQDTEQLSQIKSTIHELAFNNDIRPYVLNVFAAVSALGLVRHHFSIALH